MNEQNNYDPSHPTTTTTPPPPEEMVLGYRDGMLVRSSSSNSFEERGDFFGTVETPSGSSDWFRRWVVERRDVPVSVHQPLGGPPGWSR